MKNLIGGLAGALMLNLLHETYKRLDSKAPRVDLVGEEALSKSMKQLGLKPPEGNGLYSATLLADVITNALYYSLIGMGNKKGTLLRATVLGTTAGIGALLLTKRLGLRDAPVTRSNRTKVLTVAWYLIGALTTGVTMRAMENKA